jgi:hypothetical protein
MATYSDFQNEENSEKLGLAILHASRRLKGWVLDSGSIYTIAFDEVIDNVEDSGVALSSVASIPALVAGSFYHDRTNSLLYLWASDSSNPNGLFIAVEFKLFFATATVEAANDLSAGFDVSWLPLLQPVSNFGVNLDSQNQLGNAIEGAGTVSFNNDQSYWSSRFDKFYFENHKCFIYSWNRNLDITEAKIIYRGRVQGKSYSPGRVSFQLKDFINELRAPVPLVDMGDIAGAVIQTSQVNVKARKLYGYNFGIRPFNIDQNVNDQFDLTGTVSATSGSDTVTGSGTSFLSELSPDDNLLIANDTDEVTVASIQSDTSLTLTDPYDEETKTGALVKVTPDLPKRFSNRVHLVASHALRKPSTTITSVFGFLAFDVVDATDFVEGDPVKVGSDNSFVDRVSGNRIFLSLSLTTFPSVGTTVERVPVNNVRINMDLLVNTRDYSIDSTGPSKITLTDLAEFNIARIRVVSGTSVTFTDTLRAVTGSGTLFLTQLKPGDWIRASGESDFFEILQINSDTSLDLRTASTYTATASGQYKAPEIFVEGESVLSLDSIGISVDGTESGTLLKKGPEIVKDLLKSVSLVDADLDLTSFTDAQELTDARLGIAIPERVSGTRAPKVRDVVDKVNKSIFGSLIQNKEFLLKYNILRPVKSSSLELGDKDVLSFTLQNKADKIVKKVVIESKPLEYNFATGDSSFTESTTTSEESCFLAKTEKQFTQDTYLVDASDGQILSDRMSFLFSIGSNVIKLNLKLQGARKEVGDPIVLNHSKLFQRFGSTDSRKVLAVQGAFKSATDSRLELEDLANAFTRCAAYTDDGHNDFDTSSDSEKALAGYWTDVFGLINNDTETCSLNLYWMFSSLIYIPFLLHI